MKNILLTILTISVSVSSILNASYYEEIEHIKSKTIKVKVIKSKKIMNEVTIRKKQRECWEETVNVRIEPEPEVGGQLFGAVIGANAVGQNEENVIYEERTIRKCKNIYIPHTETIFSHYENEVEFLGEKLIKKTKRPLKELTIRYTY